MATGIARARVNFAVQAVVMIPLGVALVPAPCNVQAASAAIQTRGCVCLTMEAVGIARTIRSFAVVKMRFAAKGQTAAFPIDALSARRRTQRIHVVEDKNVAKEGAFNVFQILTAGQEPRAI